MAMTPSQMRQKEAAQSEAEKHARYAQADGSMKKGDTNSSYYVSPAIEAAGRRVNAATAKERADVNDDNASINDNRY